MFARARHSKIPSKSEIARKIQFHFFSLFSSSCSHIHTLYMCICFPQTLLLFTFKFHFSFFPSLKCTYSHRFLIVYFEIPHNCELFFCFLSCVHVLCLHFLFVCLIAGCSFFYCRSLSSFIFILSSSSFFCSLLGKILFSFSCKILTNSRYVERGQKKKKKRKKAIRLKLLVKSHCVSAIIERKIVFFPHEQQQKIV